MNCFFVFVLRQQKKLRDQRLYSQIETVSKVKSSLAIGLEQKKNKIPLYTPPPPHFSHCFKRKGHSLSPFCMNLHIYKENLKSYTALGMICFRCHLQRKAYLARDLNLINVDK